MRYATPPTIAEWLSADFSYVLNNAGFEKEQQFMRLMSLPSVPVYPSLGLVPSRAAATPSAPGPVDTSSTQRSAVHRLCMQDMLYSLRVPNFGPCSKSNCDNLHHVNIQSRLPLARLRRAALNDPITSDPDVRDALLAKAAHDPKFYKQSPP